MLPANNINNLPKSNGATTPLPPERKMGNNSVIALFEKTITTSNTLFSNPSERDLTPTIKKLTKVFTELSTQFYSIVSTNYLTRFLTILEKSKLISSRSKLKKILECALLNKDSKGATALLKRNTEVATELFYHTLKKLESAPINKVEKYRNLLCAFKEHQVKFPPASLTLTKLKLFVSLGIDVNNSDFFEVHPLITALQQRDEPLIKFVLEKGANVSCLFNPLADMKVITFFNPPNRRLPAFGIQYINILEGLKKMGAQLGKQYTFKDALLGKLLIIDSKNEGFIKLIEYVVKETNVDYNAKDASGETLLTYAIKNTEKEYECIEYIKNALKCGIDINTPNDKGETPLCAALFKDNRSTARNIAEVLFKAGAAVDDASKAKVLEVYLYQEVNSDLKDIEWLLKRGAHINSEMGFYKTSPLMFALRNKRDDLISLFLSYKPNIDQTTTEGRTALSFALDAEDTHNIKRLIELGAKNLNVRRDDALADAPGDSLMVWAGRGHHWDFMEYLLQKGISINQQNVKGETLLHVAINNRDEDLLKYLKQFDPVAVSNKVNTNIKAGQTPFAAEPVNIHAKNQKGETPLFYAMEHHTAMAHSLIEQGAELYILNDAAYAPIDMCKTKDSYKIFMNRSPLGRKIIIGETDYRKEDKAESIGTYLIRIFPEYYQAGRIEEIVELALLLNLRNVSFEIVKRIGPDAYAEMMGATIEKHHLSQDYWLCHLLTVDLNHLTKNIGETDVPTAPEEINIFELLTLFDQIPSEHLAENGDREKLRESLAVLVQSTLSCSRPDRPNETIENPKEFYADLHNYLRHLTTFAAEDLKNGNFPHVLLELAQRAYGCSTGWKLMAIELYRNCRTLRGNAIVSDFRNLVYKEFTQLRSGIVDEMSGRCVHDNLAYLQALGICRSIPGGTSVTNFKDFYAKKQPLDPVAVVKKFDRHYNAARLVKVMQGVVNTSIKKQKLEETLVFSWLQENCTGWDQNEEISKVKAWVTNKALRAAIGEERYQKRLKDWNLDQPMGDVTEPVEILKKRYYVNLLQNHIYNQTDLFNPSISLGGIVYIMNKLQLVSEAHVGVVAKVEKQLELIKEKKAEENPAKRKKVENV